MPPPPPSPVKISYILIQDGDETSNFWLRNFSFLFGFYCLLINWCRVKQFSNYCSMFGLYTFPILLITTSYLASVELLSVHDTPNANPDWSLTNMGYLNHCEAMLVISI